MTWEYKEERNFDPWYSDTGESGYVACPVRASITYKEFFTAVQSAFIFKVFMENEVLIAPDQSEWRIISIISTSNFDRLSHEQETEIELLKVKEGNGRVLKSGKEAGLLNQ